MSLQGVMGCICIGLGLFLAVIAWAFASIRKDLEKAVLGLAEHGPCSGLELKRKSGHSISDIVLEKAIEEGLVTTSYRTNDALTAAIRGELKTRIFRLTTSGWQVATRLRAGGKLEDERDES